MNCPHCKSTLLWSEDRGPHCDGCDAFDGQSLAAVAGSILRPWGMSPPQHDFPEDFSGENGQYQNVCLVCAATFLGHKDRYVCNVCATLHREQWASMSPEQKAAHAEAFRATLAKLFPKSNAPAQPLAG